MPPRFREEKARLLALCLQEDWKKRLDDLVTTSGQAKASVNALLALLSRPEVRFQAAYGLGKAVPLMAEENMESARVLMRRLMWSLNEESGNLGWGVPEAMGCILAGSAALASEYARIFISYGYQTGKDDNFLDHAPLRQGVYWGIGMLALANPEAALPALPHLAAALEDGHADLAAMAAFALSSLARSGIERVRADSGWPAASRALERARLAQKSIAGGAVVRYFDGKALVERGPAILMEEAHAAVRQLPGLTE